MDGCVYAPPYSATGVLRINPENNDKVEVLGNFPPGNYLWHGGLLAKSTGVIYAFPAHSNKVLCIDMNVQQGKSSERSGDGDGDVGGVEEDESWRVSTIPIHRHGDDIDSPDLQYKWREWKTFVVCHVYCVIPFYLQRCYFHLTEYAHMTYDVYI